MRRGSRPRAGRGRMPCAGHGGRGSARQARALATPAGRKRRARDRSRTTPVRSSSGVMPPFQNWKPGAGDHGQVDVHRGLRRHPRRASGAPRRPGRRAPARAPGSAVSTTGSAGFSNSAATSGSTHRPAPGQIVEAALAAPRRPLRRFSRDVEAVGEGLGAASRRCAARWPGPTRPSRTNGGIGARPAKARSATSIGRALVDDLRRPRP